MSYELNWKPTERHDGYGLLQIPEVSESDAVMEGGATTKSTTNQKSKKKEFSHGNQESSETTEAREVGRTSESTDRTQTIDSSDLSSTNVRSGNEERREERDTYSSGTSSGKDISKGTKESVRKGSSEKVSESQQTLMGSLESFGITSGASQESRRTHTQSVALRNHLIPLQHTEWYPSGLLIPLDAQFAKTKTILSSLDKREIVVMAGNLPAFVCQVPEIIPPFDGFPLAKEFLVTQFKARLRETHSYYFVPSEVEKCAKLPEYKSPKQTKKS